MVEKMPREKRHGAGLYGLLAFGRKTQGKIDEKLQRVAERISDLRHINQSCLKRFDFDRKKFFVGLAKAACGFIRNTQLIWRELFVLFFSICCRLDKDCLRFYP